MRPLQDQRIAQNQKLLAYQGTALTDEAADHAILDLYRKDVIGVQAIGHVLKAYDEPPHHWGGRTAWRLFNAATFTLAGKVAERPALTKDLHQIIDGSARVGALMLTNARRTYQLAQYTVEKRPKGWFFWELYGDKNDAKGPYSSPTSVALMVARQLEREIVRRDKVHELPT